MPWIQKVDSLIHTWGTNKYVRLAFLCRICGKEQKSSLTGNWRNHFQVTHSVSQPITCDICHIMLKSKHSLNEHKKAFHKVQKEGSIHSCQICQMPFQRKSDVKKHIAEKHSIIVDNLSEDKNKDKEHSKTKETDLHLRQSTKKKKLTVKMFPEQIEPSPRKSPKLKPVSTPPVNRNFICGMCYLNFKTKVELSEHQDTVHFFAVHSSVKQVYKCPKCDEEFNRHIEILNHTIKMHGIQDTVPGAITIPDEAPTMSRDVYHKKQSQGNTSSQDLSMSSPLSMSNFENDSEENLVVIIKEEDEDINIMADEKPRTL